MTEEIKMLLIASFVPKPNLEWFLRNLNDKFKIKREDVFIYNVENNDLDYLLTFKIKNNKKIDFNFYFSNATIVNIKNGCIFSINGLNRLIEMETGCEQGNVNYKNYKIDWSLHKDTLILSNKNKLIIKKIKKIENIVEKNVI
jgi:hypothetical protein